MRRRMTFEKWIIVFSLALDSLSPPFSEAWLYQLQQLPQNQISINKVDKLYNQSYRIRTISTPHCFDLHGDTIQYVTMYLSSPSLSIRVSSWLILSLVISNNNNKFTTLRYNIYTHVGCAGGDWRAAGRNDERRTNINHLFQPLPLTLIFYFISEAYNNGVGMRKSAAAARFVGGDEMSKKNEKFKQDVSWFDMTGWKFDVGKICCVNFFNEWAKGSRELY